MHSWFMLRVTSLQVSIVSSTDCAYAFSGILLAANKKNMASLESCSKLFYIFCMSDLQRSAMCKTDVAS